MLPVRQEPGSWKSISKEHRQNSKRRLSGHRSRPCGGGSDPLGTQSNGSGDPVVSEENAESHHLDPPENFFLVDPLDGTKEFLRPDGQGSFTVNIALIEKMEPVLGVIFAPALDRMFHGFKGGGSVEKSPGRRSDPGSPAA